METEHGGIDCQECHGGNASIADRESAHMDVVKDPTIKEAEGKCGECHEEIVETGVKSLHATLSDFYVVLRTRSSETTWPGVEKGRGNHCAACHSSCGQCHVSRPRSAQSGFVNGHLFQARPSMVNQCTACHGSRVGDEYFGDRGYGDVHLAEGGMDCMECHGAEEMHASGEGITTRYHLAEKSNCTDCHDDLLSSGIEQHKTHIGTVQCQVCHAQDYVNCFSCHVGKDKQGIGYFQNEKEVETFKIGKAYEGSGSSDEFILVRHVPSDKEIFDYYIEEGFPNFDKLPTWKRTSPHNIRRKTFRNQNCNNCHGQRELFLSGADVPEYAKAANRNVIVPDAEVPEARPDVEAPSPVATVDSLSVTAGELHALLEKKAVVLVDARAQSAYEKGHIEGALSFNAARYVRYPPGDLRVMTMRTPDELAKSIGDAGMDGSGKVVVYDSGSLEATMLYAALRRIGHRNVAVLDGGIEGWEEAGYHLATGTAAAVKSGTFEVRADDSVLAGNAEVAAALESKDAVVVDVRPIAQHIGLRKHPLAHRAGRIEGTVNLSVRAFWSVEGYLKDPASVAWLLESSGITRDKTIIVTCNTSQAASGAFYYLEYLGYEKAKIHDGSYVNWEQAGTSAKATPVPPPVKKAPVKAPEPEEEEEDKFGC